MIIFVETVVVHLFGLHTQRYESDSFPSPQPDRFRASTTPEVLPQLGAQKKNPKLPERSRIFSSSCLSLPSELPNFLRSMQEDSIFIHFARWLRRDNTETHSVGVGEKERTPAWRRGGVTSDFHRSACICSCQAISGSAMACKYIWVRDHWVSQATVNFTCQFP